MLQIGIEINTQAIKATHLQTRTTKIAAWHVKTMVILSRNLLCRCIADALIGLITSSHEKLLSSMRLLLVTFWDSWHHFLHRDLAFSPRLGVNRRVKSPLILGTNSVGSVEKKGSSYQPHEPGVWVAIITVLDFNFMSWNWSRAVGRDYLVLVRGTSE